MSPSTGTASDQLELTVVLEQIQEALQANGSKTREEKERLNMLANGAIITVLQKMEKKINALTDQIEIVEEKSILIWAKENRKVAILLVVFFFLIIGFFHQITGALIYWLTLLSKVI